MKTTIIAVGNCGYNIATDLQENHIIEADHVIVCDTDVKDLNKKSSDNSNEIVLLAPFEGDVTSDRSSLVANVIPSTTDVVIVCVGLGGRTGSTYAPLIALAAQKKNKVVICVFSLPFQFEGKEVKKRNEIAFSQMQVTSDFFIMQTNGALAHSESFLLGEMNRPIIAALKKLRAQYPVAKWPIVRHDKILEILPIKNNDEETGSIMMRNWYSDMPLAQRIQSFDRANNPKFLQNLLK